MRILKFKNSVVFASVTCLVLSGSIASSYADHEPGHDEVARGGIRALEQRVWDLETGVTTPLPLPRVKTVDCGSESLQAALDQAVEGDTINVSGTCNERIIVRQDRVTLDGQGSAIIDGDGLGVGSHLVRIRAMLVTFRNFKVKNSPSSGIQVHQSASALIEGNTIENCAVDGIVITNSSYARIGSPSGDHPAAGTGTGNVIQNNDRHGILVRGSSHASIFHNKITGNVDGVRVPVGGAADIDGNEISGNNRGIHFRTNGSVKLSDHPNHYRTDPVFAGLENNLVQGNSVGLHCRLGGAADGNRQNFGTGNTSDLDVSGSCAVNPAVHTP